MSWSHETVTVEHAIRRGHRLVTYPLLVIMFIGMVLPTILCAMEFLPASAIGIGIGLGFVLAWLWWGVMITRWRLWAFENVRNVHELQKRAVNESLIWREGHFFERTEFRTRADKEKWEELKLKFKKEDVFIDDYTVGEETWVHKSKVRAWSNLVVTLILTAGGVYYVYPKYGLELAIVAAVLGVSVAVYQFRSGTRKEPELVFNNEGIQEPGRMYFWSKIQNEEIVASGHSDSRTFYLRFDYEEEEIEIPLDDLDKSHTRLNTLLVLYRERSKRVNFQ